MVVVAGSGDEYDGCPFVLDEGTGGGGVHEAE